MAKLAIFMFALRSPAVQPVVIVDLRKQLLDPAGAVLGREQVARRSATELQTRPIEPFARLL